MNYLINGMIRAAIPFIVMTAIAIALQAKGETSDAKSTFIVGVIVAAVAGFSVLYTVQGWSLLKQSIVHFGCMFVVIFPCLLVSGWFEIKGFMDVVKIFGVFVAVGIVLWSIAYFIFGKLIK